MNDYKITEHVTKQRVMIDENNPEDLWEDYDDLPSVVHFECVECGCRKYYDRDSIEDIFTEFNTDKELCIDCWEMLQHEWKEYLAELKWEYMRNSGVY